jgi:hypothetical protein
MYTAAAGHYVELFCGFGPLTHREFLPRTVVGRFLRIRIERIYVGAETAVNSIGSESVSRDNRGWKRFSDQVWLRVKLMMRPLRDEVSAPAKLSRCSVRM